MPKPITISTRYLITHQFLTPTEAKKVAAAIAKNVGEFFDYNNPGKKEIEILPPTKGSDKHPIIFSKAAEKLEGFCEDDLEKQKDGTWIISDESKREEIGWNAAGQVEELEELYADLDGPVWVSPLYLVNEKGYTPEIAAKVANEAGQICRKRWKKAAVQLEREKEDFGGEQFIGVSYNSCIDDKDRDEESVAEGSYLKPEVVDEILKKALLQAGIKVDKQIGRDMVRNQKKLKAAKVKKVKVLRKLDKQIKKIFKTAKPKKK